MPYIHTTTKQYPVSEQDIRTQYLNTSFPVPFKAPEEYAVVFPAPAPAVSNAVLQLAREIAPVLTSKGNYEQAYEIVDIYSDYTNEAGIVITKAEQETEALAKADQIKTDANKEKAMQLLKETDWVEVPSVSDSTKVPHLSNFTEYMTYRMALRTIAVNPTVDATFPTIPVEQWS